MSRRVAGRGPTQSKGDHRREQILTHAAALFAEHGVAATSIRDIGREAGFTSSNLYYYFPTKEAIAAAVVARYLDELIGTYRALDNTGLDASAELEHLIRGSLVVTHRHPHASQIYARDLQLLREVDDDAFLEQTRALQQYWLSALEKGIQTQEFDSQLDSRVAFRLIRDGLWLTVRWFEPSPVYPLDRLADRCVRLYLGGVLRGVD